MIGNKIQAYAGERLSETSVVHERLGRLVIGDPSIHRVIYRVSSTPAETVPLSSWANLPGDPNGSRVPLPFPSLFKRAGLIHPDLQAIGNLLETLTSEDPELTVLPAVAFRFGEFVMAAAVVDLPEELAMRFGRKPSAVTAGLYEPLLRTFHVPELALGGDPDVALEETQLVSNLLIQGRPVY